MATITLYKDKVNGVGGLLDDIIKSVNNLDVQLDTLKNTLQGVDSSTCNLEDTVNSISSSSKSEKEKVEDLKKLNGKLTDFIETTTKRDNSARDEINKAKEDFYTKYSHLKPECEKSRVEKIVDAMKSACEWCKEHWKLLATIVIVAVSIVLLCTGVGTILAGACWGAILGAVIGGVSGGLDSMAQGGSFLDGFEDGAFSGAVGGAIGGAAFAGLGALGGTIGKGIDCASKLGKFIKGTAAVTKVISGVMDGFDTIALLDKAFGNGNIAALNAKLHESAVYNYFQIGVNAVAVLTGGMTSTMSCFVAGTLVMTAAGILAIERIKAGDVVVSANPDTFEVANKKVLETYVREVDRLVHIVVNGETIITTFDHPFYVRDKGFVHATNLWIGAELIDRNGNILNVEQVYHEYLEDEKRTVYNFQVEDYHTYFVGEQCIWVHNADCTIEFTNKSGLDEKEFKQQLADQQDGLNNMTVEEYQQNRAAYEANGRASDSAKYQQEARKEFIADRIDQNVNDGMTYEDACMEAANWASDKAALHGPDQIAGGSPSNITGLGDSKINSSIGSQWKAESRIGALDKYVANLAAGLTEAEKSITYLDVELILK